MSLKLNSSGGGSVTLQEPSTASTRTLTLPDNTGSLVSTADTGTVTPTMLSQPLTLMTAQTASGTSVDFTGIPSWVKRIEVMFVGVSTNGTSSVLVQLGTSGGLQTSSYLGAVNDGDTAAANQQFSSGFSDNTNNSAIVRHGMYEVCLVTGNTWACRFQQGFSNSAAVRQGAGSIALSGTLDRVRITTLNGTDTFDAGTINVMYEG